MVAVGIKTIDYFEGRPFAPQGEAWEAAVEYWKTLQPDAGAEFDAEVVLVAEDIEPQVSWGTSPEMVVGISDFVPNPANESDPIKRGSIERAPSHA